MKKLACCLFLAALLCLPGALAQSVRIPAQVRVIEAEAFYGDASLTDVTVPDGVLRVGPRAFARSGLKTISLPVSVTDIASDAFEGCEVLVQAAPGSYAEAWCAEHKIPCDTSGFAAPLPAEYFNYTVLSDNTARITGYVGPRDVSGLTLPDALDGHTVTQIGGQVFQEMSTLTGRLTLPRYLTEIDAFAFYGCSGLTGPLSFPCTLTRIGNGAFSGCEGLTGSLFFPEGLAAIGPSAFSGCTGLNGDLSLPSTLRELGGSAFIYCSGLTGNVIIPRGVTVIHDYTFWDCQGLNGELRLPDTITAIEFGAFYNCKNLRGTLSLPSLTGALDNWTFAYCGKLTGALYLPEGVTRIGDFCFYNCGGLESLRLPGTLTEIGERAFENCTSLTGSISLPAALTRIGGGAFSGCAGLTGDLILPDGVTALYARTFWGCSGLDGELRLPGSLTAVEMGAFYGCENLRGALSFPGLAGEVGQWAFGYCRKLTGAPAFPDGVTGIGEYAFYCCEGLTGVQFPGSLREIGANAFQYCGGLSGTVAFPEGLQRIGDKAFGSCSAIGRLTFSSSLISFGDDPFDGVRHARVSFAPDSYAETWYRANYLEYLGTDNTWNVLAVACREVRTDIFKSTFTNTQMAHVIDSFNLMPETVRHLSGGLWDVNLHVIQIDEPVTSLTKGDGQPSFVPGSGDIDLTWYLDHEDVNLVIICLPSAGYPGTDYWMGLGGDYVWYDGRPIYQMTMNTDFVWNGTWTDEGYTYLWEQQFITHEMLHCVECNSQFRGWDDFQIVHSAEDNGYTSEGAYWLDWHRDLIRDTLKSGNRGFLPQSFLVDHYRKYK